MSRVGFMAKEEFTSGFKRSKAETCVTNQMSAPMSQHQGNRRRRNSKKKFQKWRCHHCGRFGHIKPFCFRLFGYLDHIHYDKPEYDTCSRKQWWVAKNVSLVAECLSKKIGTLTVVAQII